MRLRPQSELGWHMLQWLAVLVLGHQAQANPALLRGVARTLATRKAPAPVMALVECGCCLREVAKLDGLYETCEACAECLSLGQCYDLAEGDLGHNVNCCHGANHGAAKHGMVITGIDQEKGIITVEATDYVRALEERMDESGQRFVSNAIRAALCSDEPDIVEEAWAACTPEEREKLGEMIGRFRAEPDRVARTAEYATPLIGGPPKPGS